MTVLQIEWKWQKQHSTLVKQKLRGNKVSQEKHFSDQTRAYRWCRRHLLYVSRLKTLRLSGGEHWSELCEFWGGERIPAASVLIAAL